MIISNTIFIILYVILNLSFFLLNNPIGIFFILIYSYLFLNFSEFSQIAFISGNKSNLGYEIDLNIYSRMIFNICEGKLSSDNFFNQISPFFCLFPSDLALKIIIFLNIFIQIILICKLCENKKIAKFIYFAFGSFYWINFNTVSQAISVSMLIFTILFLKKNKLAFLGSAFWTAYAIHPSVFPTFISLIYSSFKKFFFVVFLIFLYVLFLLYKPIIVDFIVSIDDRFARYFTANDGLSLSGFLYLLFTFFFYVFFKFWKGFSPYTQIHFFIYLMVLFVVSLDFTYNIQNDILNRCITPMVFFSLYETGNTLFINISKSWIRISFLLAIMCLSLISLTNSQNGWSFLSSFN